MAELPPDTDETIREAIENCKGNGHWQEDISDALLAAEFLEHGVFDCDDTDLEALTVRVASVRQADREENRCSQAGS